MHAYALMCTALDFFGLQQKSDLQGPAADSAKGQVPATKWPLPAGRSVTARLSKTHFTLCDSTCFSSMQQNVMHCFYLHCFLHSEESPSTPCMCRPK